MPLAFATLALTCAPSVHPTTLAAVVRNESGENPYAIGVVGGHLVRQPRSLSEAKATVDALERAGWNYSVGMAQVNRANFARYRLAGDTLFDPCANLRAGSEILADCYRRAAITAGPGQRALRQALSCYYSGNETRGFKVERGGTSYVHRVVALAQNAPQSDAAAKSPNPSSDPGRSAQVVPPIDVVRDPVAVRAVKRATAEAEPAPGTQAPARATWDVFGDFEAGKGPRD